MPLLSFCLLLYHRLFFSLSVSGMRIIFIHSLFRSHCQSFVIRIFSDSKIVTICHCSVEVWKTSCQLIENIKKQQQHQRKNEERNLKRIIHIYTHKLTHKSRIVTNSFSTFRMQILFNLESASALNLLQRLKRSSKTWILFGSDWSLRAHNWWT